MRTYFVSGHLDLLSEEFAEHYIPRLRAAALEDSRFVIGDARGADSMAQAYLVNTAAHVTVFHMFKAPRNTWPRFALRGGFTTDIERDTAMTNASDADIAWVRIGRNGSGTAANLDRRVNKPREGGKSLLDEIQGPITAEHLPRAIDRLEDALKRMRCLNSTGAKNT